MVYLQYLEILAPSYEVGMGIFVHSLYYQKIASDVESWQSQTTRIIGELQTYIEHRMSCLQFLLQHAYHP